ncbi:interference hedgehog-like protein [Plakobranchus ocellatus]|uniref:Interference hedgehog-like protein n=1 Tax=Plakobranchus ocellatus TaxID=259542 RepID=A0AAV4AUM7_9GAST|nr:interference hedgehog-like protein [Plakobranchus ocellatus]
MANTDHRILKVPVPRFDGVLEMWQKTFLCLMKPTAARLRPESEERRTVRRLPSGSLVLSNINAAAAGTYSCVAVNEALGKNVTSPYVINLSVSKADGARSVGVLRGPRRMLRAVLGSSVTLECPSYGSALSGGDGVGAASGYHASAGTNVVWTKAGGSLPAGRYRTDLFGNLVIEPVDSLDAGTYYCSESQPTLIDGIQNDFAASSGFFSPRHNSSVFSWVDRPEVTLEMLTAPVAQMVRAPDDPVVVGEKVELSCFVGGYPAPQLTWYHNGRRLEGADMFGDLILREVTLADMGLYQCMATNEVGSAQGVARLRVKEKPERMEEDEEDVDSAVKEREQTSSDKGNNGERATRKRERKKQGRRRNMKLKDRRKKKNQQKFSSHTNGKPKYKPSAPEVEQLSDRSVKLSWEVPDKGNGQTIKFFKVQYKETKGEWKTSDAQLASNTRDFEVSGLKSGASYKFRVLAVYEDNDNLNSDSSDLFYLTVDSAADVSKPDTPPTIVEVKPVQYQQSFGLGITWQYKAESASPVEGFVILYKPFESTEDYAELILPGPGIRNHVLQNLQSDTDYTIRMQSFNSEGVSDYSNKVNGKTRSRDPSISQGIPPLLPPRVEPPMTDSPETNRQQRSRDELGQPIILCIAIGVLLCVLVPLVTICLCKYKKQKRRNLASNSEQKFQEQAQCFLAAGGDHSAAMKQHQQVNGGLYPSANPMSMAGSSGGQGGHNRMNLEVNPLADYDLQTSVHGGGSGFGAGRPKQYFSNGGINGMGSRYGGPGDHHQHTCNNNPCQHPHMACHGDMAYMEQQQQQQQQAMHSMQHRTLPLAPTPHSFYSEAGSLGRMPSHSTSTVNHDYSEPGEHELIMQQKQRAGMPMSSSSGLSHPPPPLQQPPQPPPPLLLHQHQQQQPQQHPFYNQAGGLDMVGHGHGLPHNPHPQQVPHHSSVNAAAQFHSNNPNTINTSSANPGGVGAARHYDHNWPPPYDQPRGSAADGAGSSGTLGKNVPTSCSKMQHHYNQAAQTMSERLSPTHVHVPASSSSSSSYSPTKTSDCPSNFGGAPPPSAVHPHALMSAGQHMRFAAPSHMHGRTNGREGQGGGKHQKRRRKRPHGREHQSGMCAGAHETGMKDQATNTDLSSNEGTFEFATFAPGVRGKPSSLGGSSQSGSDGEGRPCMSGSEVDESEQVPEQGHYHYCDSSFANHGSTESLEAIEGEDSDSAPPGSSDEEDPLQNVDPNHYHPYDHHHHLHHQHPQQHSKQYHHQYRSRQQQTSPTSATSATYQAIYPSSSTQVPVPL